MNIYKFMFSEMQEFRAKMLRLVLAYDSVLLLIAGWVFKSDVARSRGERIVFTIGLLAVLAVTLHVVQIFERYFLAIAKLINKIDNLIGAYTPDAYIGNLTLFPLEWNTFGHETWREPIFYHSRITVFVTTAFALLVVWLRG
jgi:hypothetical protein